MYVQIIFFSFFPPKGSSTYHVHYEKRNHPCQDKMCEMALAAHQLHERQTDIAWHVEIDESLFCYIQSSHFFILKMATLKIRAILQK